MSKLIKVEIKLVDGEWQWLGKLSKNDLKALCTLADNLSDASEKDLFYTKDEVAAGFMDRDVLVREQLRTELRKAYTELFVGKE